MHSAILQPADAGMMQSGLTKIEVEVLDTLKTLSGGFEVAEKSWRDAAYAIIPTKAKRNSFARIKLKLIKMQLIELIGDKCRIVSSLT